jgi:hypothetical protein
MSSPVSPSGFFNNYVVPITSAGAAVVLPFRYFIMKSELQKGALKAPHISFLPGIKEGVKAAPFVGIIVGMQIASQEWIEEKIVGTGKWHTKFTSSALVGALSSLPLAIYNGLTLNQGWIQSCKNFSLKQGGAITIQETTFVLGVKCAKPLAKILENEFGESRLASYGASFFSAGAGSLAGHFANTALTRWQVGLRVEFNQLMWGAKHKTLGVACFGVLYKIFNDTFKKGACE